ncbi:MAG: hypothetical protein OCD76_22050 [Reichenbachiella sp.]
MKFNVIIILLLLSILFSCKEDVVEGSNVDTGVIVLVVTENGDNLLDQDTEGAFLEEDIWLYHLVDGKAEKFYNSMWDEPKGFVISNDFDGYDDGITRIAIGLNGVVVDEYAFSYIEWNESDTDTLKYEIVKNNGRYVSNLWCNEKLVWGELSLARGDREFTLIK